MSEERPLRVLHCPTTVGGNPQGLARAERELGVDSVAVSFNQNYFKYETDEVLWTDEDSAATREIKRMKLLVRAVRDFDVIHFNFGQSCLNHSQEFRIPSGSPWSILWRYCSGVAGYIYRRMIDMRDLPLLKRLGKGIVVTYQGSDARQGDFCYRHFGITAATELPVRRGIDYSDADIRRRIAIFTRYADRIFALNPDLLHVLPSRATFMPYASVDPDSCTATEGRGESVFRIAHAPTNRDVKGTRFLLAACDKLKAEFGDAVELVLLEKLSHAEARKAYETVDVLVDQLLLGWYGGVAVELMALGKPVVCYIRDEDLKFIPPAMRTEMPIIRATPTDIHEVLRNLVLLERSELRRIGMLGRAYVQKWHNPKSIAAELIATYTTILQNKRRKR